MDATDKELIDFVKWYKKHFGKREETESVFITSMCGAFHSYTRAMKAVLERMVALAIIKREKDWITIL